MRITDCIGAVRENARLMTMLLLCFALNLPVGTRRDHRRLLAAYGDFQ
ncbi:hypothetical protein [Novosphingobium sp.]|nr:hypothetical protein [Novosphingobium sp.]HKR91237.1 hypothetical protein [Novosphingobium sp.]